MAKSPAGMLQALSIPEAIWEDLAMDFVAVLPKSKGFEIIMVGEDRLSKAAHFILLKHHLTAKGVADLFM